MPVLRAVEEEIVLPDGRRAKRIRLDDVRAGLEILPRESRSITSGFVSSSNSLLPLRSLPFQSRKRSPRKSASVQLVALHHRAHRAIDDDDALLEQGGQGMERFFSRHGVAQ